HRVPHLAPAHFVIFLQALPTPRALPPFPTRRSSDLPGIPAPPRGRRRQAVRDPARANGEHRATGQRHPLAAARGARRAGCGDDRSEEHTSELQSLTNLVCRLLLEKQKAPTPPLPPLT